MEGRKRKYIMRSIYLYEEDLNRLYEIAEKVGAKSISDTIRMLIRNAEVEEDGTLVVKLLASSIK